MTLAGHTGKTSKKGRDDAGSDVSRHSYTPVRSPAARDDSYTATFESDSHAASTDVHARDNGTIASAYPIKCCDLLDIIVTVVIKIC